MSSTSTIEYNQSVAEDNIERTMTGLKDGVATATAGAEQIGASMRDGLAKMMRMAEEMMSFSQGNLEAFTRSGQILAGGMQDMTQMVAASAKASMDETMGAMRAIAGSKSVKEAMDLQSGLLRAGMEKAVTQGGQIAEKTMKLSEQAFAPIGSRVKLATETFARIG